MNDDEIIDKVLAKLFDKGITGVYLGEFISRELEIEDRNKSYAIRDKLEYNDLAEIKTTGMVARITAFGREVQEFGGWLKYLSHKESEARRQREKDDLDFKLAKETLEEFPKTKRRAKVGYIIAIILAVVQVAQWIIELLSDYASD